MYASVPPSVLKWSINCNNKIIYTIGGFATDFYLVGHVI